MAISSVSGVASVHAPRPVDSEHPPRERKPPAHVPQPETDAEAPPDETVTTAEVTIDGEHHIHVIA